MARKKRTITKLDRQLNEMGIYLSDRFYTVPANKFIRYVEQEATTSELNRLNDLIRIENGHLNRLKLYYNEGFERLRRIIYERLNNKGDK